MDIKEFQKKCLETAIYNREKYAVIYPVVALAGECGEILNKTQKVMRDYDFAFNDEHKLSISKEIGDCFWFIAMYALDSGFDVENFFLEILKKDCYKLSIRNIMLFAIDANCSGGLAAMEFFYGENGNLIRTYDHVINCSKSLINLSRQVGHSVDSILESKIAMLADRKERGVISGSGDNR